MTGDKAKMIAMIAFMAANAWSKRIREASTD